VIKLDNEKNLKKKEEDSEEEFRKALKQRENKEAEKSIEEQ